MPLVLSVSLSLPSLLLHLPHPMSAIPGGDICLTSDSDILQQQHTFQSSVAILGFCLPLAIIICLVIGLSVRLDISIHIILLRKNFTFQEMCELLQCHLRLLVLQGGAALVPVDHPRHVGQPPGLPARAGHQPDPALAAGHRAGRAGQPHPRQDD